LKAICIITAVYEEEEGRP